MSYSTSPLTLNRILREYAPLLQGKACIWHRPLGADPNRWAHRWAYKLREGLTIAKLYPEQFRELAQLADDVKIVTTAVTVEMYLSLRPAVEVEVREITQRIAPEVAHSQTTFEDVLHMWQERRRSGVKLYVEKHSLTEAEQQRLAHTLRLDGWMVLRSRDGALTLAPDDAAVPLEARVQP